MDLLWENGFLGWGQFFQSFSISWSTHGYVISLLALPLEIWLVLQQKLCKNCSIPKNYIALMFLKLYLRRIHCQYDSNVVSSCSKSVLLWLDHHLKKKNMTWDLRSQMCFWKSSCLKSGLGMFIPNHSDNLDFWSWH